MGNAAITLMELLPTQKQNWLNIGEVARASGVSVKMIRHYESINLICAAHRTRAGYRMYTAQDIRILSFVQRGRVLGFSLNQIRSLLALWQDKHRASKDVRALAMHHIADLDRRIQEVQSMQRSLQMLAATCHDDQRPDCPILDDFLKR